MFWNLSRAMAFTGARYFLEFLLGGCFHGARAGFERCACGVWMIQPWRKGMSSGAGSGK